MTRLSANYEAELERFKKQVSNHRMQVLRDDGLYRHLRFKAPETTNQYFDIVTWPGSLCFTGDMGTYVFSRIRDMFDFFRGCTDDYRIDYRYWAEKLQSEDKFTRVKNFSPDLFRELIKKTFDSWAENEEENQDFIDDVWYRVEEEVLSEVDNGANFAYRAALDFRVTSSIHPRVNNRDFIFQDFWEINCDEYTYHFLWCCWALRWAIGVYDTYTQTTNKQ